MVMTVLMHDARHELEHTHGKTLSANFCFHDLLYADDTLLIDADENIVLEFMTCVGEMGQEYGLSFNWSKLEVLPVRTNAHILKPDGEPVKTKTSMMYLGAMLSNDGRVGSELGRRIGNAEGDFRVLRKVWNHSTLTMRRKLHIVDACVVPKLLYGLHTTWLNVVERRRLDGFHARCLRRILGVPAAYYSRVSNAEVLARASAHRLSTHLLAKQLQYMGQVAAKEPGNTLRDCVFIPGAIDLRSSVQVRGRGRPRSTWANSVYSKALEIASSKAKLEELWPKGREHEWRATVRQHLYGAA